MDTSYTCSCCGKIYDSVPLCFGADFPYYYLSIPTHEITARVEITESLCVIDESHFFHRGRITIPIIDHDEDLIFNVWTTISRENFEKRNTIWNDPERTSHPPYFGWLQTMVPTYGDTINIMTMAHENEVGLIPDIKVDQNHAIGQDQLTGITYESALKKVQVILSTFHAG